MKLFNRIWIKITLSVVAIIIVMMAVVSFLMTNRYIANRKSDLNKNMGQIAKQIASIRLAETEGWYVYQEWIDNIIDTEIGSDLVYIAIFDENDEIAAFSLNLDLLDLTDENVFTRQAQMDIVKRLSVGQLADESMRDFDHIMVNIRRGDESLGLVDVGFSLITFNDQVRYQVITTIVLLGTFLWVGVLGSIMLSRRITRPLNNLSAAMQAVAQGDLSQKVEREQHDEIGQLSHIFNNMTSSLREKSIIEDFTRELGFTYDYTRLLQIVTKRIVESVDASKGMLFAFDDIEGKSSVASPIYCWPEKSFDNSAFAISEQCYDILLETGTPFKMEKLHDDEIITCLENRCEALNIENVSILIPLTNQQKLYGFMVLAQKNDKTEYSSKDIAFLSTLARQAELGLDNAFMLVELAERERYKNEINIAKQVQKRLLPESAPQMPGLDVAGLCLPARDVGGDYFDYFNLGDGKLGIAIADVAGKGTSAAFYMAEIKGMMMTLAPIFSSPKEVLAKVNEQMVRNVDKRVFATLIYGILDISQRTFTFVRAGHSALLVKRETGVDMLIPSGLGIGLAKNDVFEKYLDEQRVDLNPGDALLLYTDGISEAMNKDHEEYGEEKLVEFLESKNAPNSQQFLANLVSNIMDFSSNKHQHDDITVVMARLI